MDLNYLLNCEQHSLCMAENSLSASARHAHLAFAKAYGAFIAATPFPHCEFVEDTGWSPRDTDSGDEVKWSSNCKDEGRRLKLGSELLSKVELYQGAFKQKQEIRDGI